MFKRNDYALLVGAILFFVLFCLEVVLSLSIGIWLMTKTTEEAKFWIGVGFAVIVGGWFVSCIGWIINRCVLSYFCDIKLIRNKIYGEDIEGLKILFKPLKSSEKPNVKANKKRMNIGDINNEQDDNANKKKTKKISKSLIIMYVSLGVAIIAMFSVVLSIILSSV